MSALGQKQTFAGKSDVRFAPNSDRNSGFPHKVMSALPPKADMCSAARDVCFGPIADICSARVRVRFTPESGQSTLRHGVRRIRIQVSQQNALIEFPELTINAPQPVLQLDIVVRIEHGGTL
jgi:hypothetical protein